MLRALLLLLLLSPIAVAQRAGVVAFMQQAQAVAAGLPPPPVCSPAQADADGRLRRHLLPERIIGAAAGTTGGLGRRLFTVSRTDDGAASQPDTLRWAVAAAGREGGGWIAFSPSLAGQTIILRAGLRLTSDTTIDGGCGGITLLAPAYETTLLIDGASNIIISGLTFAKTPYAEPDGRIADAVGLRDGFDRVAIMNNAFARCGDGCIDIVRREISPAPGRVTVAFNRIENHNKVMLVGTLACTQQRTNAACEQPLEHLGNAMLPSIRVSLVGNVFLGTSQRHPKAVAGAFVHSVNNLTVLAATTYSHGQDSAVYGGAAASGGLIASEGDILVNPTPRSRIGLGPVSAQRARGAEAREADGAVAIASGVAIGAVRMVPHRPELARAALAEETAPARPRLAPADAVRLAGCLLRSAGPAGAAMLWADGCPGLGVSIDTNLGQSSRAAASQSR